MESNSFIQSTTDMPLELLSRPPRKIQKSPNSAFKMIVFIVANGLIVIGCFCLCKVVEHQTRIRTALRQEGVEALGEITQLEHINKGQDEVKYTFTVNGEAVYGRAAVPSELMRSLRESKFLKIRYIPSNPNINHPTAWEESFSSFWITIYLVIVFEMCCSLYIIYAYKKRQLISQGKPVIGFVKGCAPAYRSFSVRYEFRTEAGDSVIGSGYSKNRHEIGTTIWVLYMPQNPGRNLPYPVPDYIVTCGQVARSSPEE
ncbi:MAG: hypothetical protein ABSG00_13600 [Terracidiphilus sp.]